MVKHYQLVKLGTLGLSVVNINTLLQGYNNDSRVKEATIFGFDNHYHNLINYDNISTTMYIMLELN